MLLCICNIFIDNTNPHVKKKKKVKNNGSLINNKEKKPTFNNINYEHGHNVMTMFGNGNIPITLDT